MGESCKIRKRKANENIIRIETIGNFARPGTLIRQEQRSQTFACSTFV